MKQREFTYLLEDFVAETLDYHLSEYDKRYFWSYFQRLSENLKCDLSAAWDLETMIHYDAVGIQKVSTQDGEQRHRTNYSASRSLASYVRDCSYQRRILRVGASQIKSQKNSEK